MTKVTIGLVGCGFVAELHMYAYKRVYGIDPDALHASMIVDAVRAGKYPFAGCAGHFGQI
jgi:predicted dehydrogenase